MTKRIIVLLLLVATLTGCDSVKQGLTSTYNIINCEYSYKSISGLSISGINVSNGLSVTNIAKVTSIFSGTASSIPLNFTLNLNVKNPNQSSAMLHGLQYIISIDDIEFTTGSVSQSLDIAAGETQILPLTIGLDLASLMKNNSKEAVTDIAKNFLGLGTKASTVSLQLKPSFLIAGQTVASPMYIPVSFSFGGN